MSMVRMRASPRFSDYCFFLTRENLKGLNIALEELEVSNTLRCLDLGCGDRPFDELIEGRFRNAHVEMTGVDFNSKRADLSGDIVEICKSLPDQSYDFIILSEVLEHLPNPNECLDAVIRISKPGAIVFISVPFMFPVHGKPYDFFRYTEFYFHHFFRKHDCEVIKYGHVGNPLTTPFLIICQSARLLLRKLFLLELVVMLFLNMMIFVLDLMWRILPFNSRFGSAGFVFSYWWVLRA